MTDRTIVVMARPLVRGSVKTRLARALGDDAALAVYERLLRGTLDARRAGARRRARAGGGASRAGRGRHGRRRRRRRPPCGPHGLDQAAAKRRRAWRAARRSRSPQLSVSGADAVVIVGSDSPSLPPEYLEQAFAELREADLVLGPAADGGYYLIGAVRRTWAAGALEGLLGSLR